MLPEIRFTSGFALPTYFLFHSLLFSFLFLFLPWWSRREQKNIRISLNLAMVITVAGFIGARSFHVFYEGFAFYLQNPIKIFYFAEGGYVFYGGAILATLAAWLYLRWSQQPFLSWADFTAPVAALFYSIGRVGCLFAGCCYGRTCELPFAINGRHPTQLYASFWELAVFGLLLLLRNQRFFFKNTGMLFFTWIALHSVGRLIMEYFRGDFRGQVWLGLSISSWISLLLLGIAGAWIVRTMSLNKQVS